MVEFKMQSSGSGIFHQKQQQAPSQDMEDLKNTVTEAATRLRILEERFTNLRKNSQVTEQNMLQEDKRMKDRVNASVADVDEIKKEIFEIKETIKLLVREIKDAAKKEDVKLLERYMDMWQPMKFVSEQKVRKIVHEMLDEQRERETKSL